MEKDHPYIGVDAIIQNDEGKILLLKRSNDRKVYPSMWSLPSGMVEWGEEVREALIRELKEEANLDIEIDKFTGRYYDGVGRHPTKTVICLPHYCKITGGEMKLNEENSGYGWFAPKEISNIDLAFDHKQMLIDEGLIWA